ncbi:MAG TPA: PhzF family phenazine biosynthesis protein [Candidatus Polarisedimenticolia bacterium]|nr:PhzF family phenazine biosynthesis protein [Candidatus Polarisedimenticolia bacterium]
MTPPGREIPIVQVDAFTTTPFAGNPAGVVLQAADLTDAQMQAIAREMNLSETAFLLPASGAGADLRIRWFTPALEVELCGHATVATFHAALEAGRLEPGRYRLECLSGILPVRLDRDEAARAVVSMGLPVPAVEPVTLASCRVAEALRVETDDFDRRFGLMRAGPWLLAPMASLQVLGAMAPDFAALCALGSETGMGNTIALTTETVEASSAVHLRMFAPGYGIDEDPVTGSAQGPVAAWLARFGLITAGKPGADGIARYVAEQGDAIGRAGRIRVEAGFASGQLDSVTISGRAVTVLRGTVILPA